ncbi:MAG: thioredoxin family protein [Pseudomonadota bacterium]
MKKWALALACAGMVLASPVAAGDQAASDSRIEPRLTDDGLYTQDWFLQSFLDLNEDLETAAASGKRFAILWELKGCVYCKETHEVNFADPEINAYVKENFEILQLNYLGSRLVTDFDGEELEERALREKYGVRFTPTFQFFPETSEEIAGEIGQAAETLRMTGYVEPNRFTAMFNFVRDKAYDEQTFQEYLEASGGS